MSYVFYVTKSPKPEDSQFTMMTYEKQQILSCKKELDNVSYFFRNVFFKK